MDTSTQIVTAKTAPTGKRQRRSIAEKRRIVEETLVEGASVARVARAHGVNANQVFYWRKLHQTGKLGTSDGVRLLPVRVKQESRPRTISHQGPESFPASSSPNLSSGTIHIDLRQAQVRIEGNADPALLRVLLECLGR
jgi:transposase